MILILILDFMAYSKGFHDNGFNIWSGFKAAIIAKRKGGKNNEIDFMKKNEMNLI